jgi:carboxypeptidase Taq
LREREINLDVHLAQGDAGPATRWLREALQRHGSLREPRQTVAAAIGGDPSEEPLLDYLEAKFGGLYGL